MVAYLCALRQSMADGQLGHIIPLLPQRDEVIVDARLILPRVVEIELLGLNIVFAQLLHLEFRDFLQKALLLFQRHAPYYHDPVLEQEHFRDMHTGVEVGRDGALKDGVAERGLFGDDRFQLAGGGRALVEDGGVGCGFRGLEVDQVFAAASGVLFYFDCGVGKSSHGMGLHLVLFAAVEGSNR